MAKKDSIFEPQMNMKRYSVRNWIIHGDEAARVPNDREPALKVVIAYQDARTRHWATEWWNRLGRLIDSGGICCKSWKIGDLTQTHVFADAVQAAAEAHVLIVSAYDGGQLPMSLYEWVDAWMPNRVGSEGGALVALIGVLPRPDSRSGRAYGYLESVARRAGLDFLPHERKLPESPPALSSLSQMGNLISTTVALPRKISCPSAGAAMRRRLKE
jgi:hypothetical protein